MHPAWILPLSVSGGLIYTAEAIGNCIQVGRALNNSTICRDMRFERTGRNPLKPLGWMGSPFYSPGFGSREGKTGGQTTMSNGWILGVLDDALVTWDADGRPLHRYDDVSVTVFVPGDSIRAWHFDRACEQLAEPWTPRRVTPPPLLP